MRLFLRLLRYSLILLIVGIVLGCAGIGIAYWLIAPRLPSVEALRDVPLQVPLRVYSADNKLIATIGEIRRIPKKIDEMPAQLKNAFIAAEDANFYNHPGVDWQGLVRALGMIISKGSLHHVAGGSTITQQVARDFFLSSEVSLSRKATEIFLSFRIEHSFTKEILELYLNKIFFGNRAYGVAAAADFYYGKTLDQLTLAECAMLASLPKFPSTGNPLNNRARAAERRAYVLQRMLENGFITDTQFKEANAEHDLSYAHEPTIEVEAPYIAELVRRDALDRLGNEALTGAYTIRTTLDSQAQEAANQALREGLLSYDQRHGYRGAEAHVELSAQATPAEFEKQLDAFRPVVRADSGHRHRKRRKVGYGVSDRWSERTAGLGCRRLGTCVSGRNPSWSRTQTRRRRAQNGRYRTPDSRGRHKMEIVANSRRTGRTRRVESGGWRNQGRGGRIQFLAQQIQPRRAGKQKSRLELQTVLLRGSVRTWLHTRIDHQ